MKVCPKCKQHKDDNEFYKHKTGKLNTYCKTCSAEKTRDWYWKLGGRKISIELKRKIRQNNPELDKEKLRLWGWNLKIDAIKRYGGKCSCCGITEPKFLAIDHINGNGNTHRKEIGHIRIGLWLKRNNYPAGFQVLCHNCNMAKAFWKICPHREKFIRQNRKGRCGRQGL